MDLIPSLAFTALLELHPFFASLPVDHPDYRSLYEDMTEAMRQACAEGCQDLWEFAHQHIESKRVSG